MIIKVMMIIFIIITFIIPLVSIYSTWTKHILNSTNVPICMRWTSWLFTIAAKELKWGYWKTPPMSRQSATWPGTSGLQVQHSNCSDTLPLQFPHNTDIFKLGCILCMLHQKSLAWVSKVSKPPWKRASMFQLAVNNFADWHFHLMVPLLMASRWKMPEWETVSLESMMSHGSLIPGDILDYLHVEYLCVGPIKRLGQSFGKCPCHILESMMSSKLSQ